LVPQGLLERSNSGVAWRLAGLQDGAGLPPVAAREDGLDRGPTWAVATDVDTARVELRTHVGQLLLERGRRILRRVLHRRLRLGDEATDVQDELGAVAAGLGREAFLDELRLGNQRVQILLLLRRQANHV